jgi:PAS domain S-box-containing protein
MSDAMASTAASDLPSPGHSDAALQRYEVLVRLSRDIVLFVRRDDGRILDANPAAEHTYGHSREELLTLTIHDLRASGTQPLSEQQMAAADSGGVLFETVHVRKDGSTFPVEVNSIGVTVAGSHMLMSVVRDITERTRTVEALKRSEESLAASQRQAHVGSFDYDFVADQLQWSEEMFRILGIGPEKFHSKPDDFLGHVHPEDRPRLERLREQGLSPGAGTLSTEFRIQRPDGSLRFVRMLFETAFDDEGRPLRRFGTFLDLTEAKKAEEESAALQAQLLQAQKMEAVGQLAGGIAHDFNNMLGAMILQLDVLRLTPDLPSEEVREIATESLASANRAADLTKQLLLFSRGQGLKEARYDANAILRGLHKLLRRMIHESVDLVLDLSGEPLWIQGDAGMIEQVVTNLCVNAQDAMPHGGKLTVSTRMVTIDDASAHHRGAPRGGRFVCLRVTDNGDGIEPAILGRIFEPFFTTKPQGKGTGLGLATVHGIVAKHGGFVEVESRVGQGSTFCVYVPGEPGTEGATEPRPQPNEIRGGVEAILLVEDEEFVRRATVRSLRNLGYRVTEAVNGLDALRVWEREGGRFDLLLTDMVMPEGLSGLELCSRLRQLKENLKVLIVSGYSALDEASAFRHGVGYLSKPFDKSTLAARLRECLDS